MSNLSLKILILAGSLGVSAVNAAEQHAGDIQPYLFGGKVQLNAEFFEADFGDLGGGLYKTDDPGFDIDTSKGAFGAGNWLQVQGLGNLQFWNGSIWSNAVPNGETIQIEDALGNLTSFTSAGVTNPYAIVGQFDASGDIHEHLDFSIRNSSNALGGSVGAYWITLAMFDTLPNSTAALSTPSDAFNIIFNRGLNAVAYETAVSAAVAAVPVPAAVWLFASGLVLPLIKRRYA